MPSKVVGHELQQFSAGQGCAYSNIRTDWSRGWRFLSFRGHKEALKISRFETTFVFWSVCRRQWWATNLYWQKPWSSVCARTLKINLTQKCHFKYYSEVGCCSKKQSCVTDYFSFFNIKSCFYMLIYLLSLPILAPKVSCNAAVSI